MKQSTRLLLLAFAGLDILFGPLIVFAFLQLLQPKHLMHAAAIMMALLVVKMLAIAWVTVSSFKHYEAFAIADKAPEKAALVATADQHLQAYPTRIALSWTGSWTIMLALSYFILSYADHYFGLDPDSWLAAFFIIVSVWFGAFVLAFPLGILLTARPTGECSTFAQPRAIPLYRRPVRLQTRIGVMSIALGLAPMLWMVAAGYWTQVVAVREALNATTPEAAQALYSAAGNGFLLNAGIFSVLVCFWAPIGAMTLSRAVSAPIERLSAATREIVEEGNQTNMDVLPTSWRDEVGLLSERFNDLIEMMRDLSRGADAIARGNLHVNIQRSGELPDAFRRMTTSLNDLVGKIRQASVELAAAATEILAASQEQETAATSQSSAMTEISHTMDSLSNSAAHVSESVAGVLANAEQTLVTTDSMVERIESLSAHTGRMSEILDVIRDIADKSDLLALNGSLEASRAGEGGHGFSLVAAEMRRLAVRVTGSVQDVKKLVVDVRESSSSTIMATEEGRRLARATTEAARNITLVSQQQRSGTEQVSQSIRGMTDIVTQATAATSQTRTSAQGLKRQADLLGELVRRFEVSEGTG
jgi:methyl-accepting chemotaxis protein